MTGKKKVIVLIGVGIASFAISFVLFCGGPEAPPTVRSTGVLPRPNFTAVPDEATTEPMPVAPVPQGERVTQMRQEQLEQLIVELRAKIEDLDKREAQLVKHEARIKLAEQLLEEKAKELENLQLQLVGPLDQLKQTLAEIRQSRIVITRDEEANLRTVAKMYDKMDSTSCSEILSQMCVNSQIEDAVKLLRYMTDKKAARALTEMTDKTMAAELSQRMKHLTVQES